jgi:dihydrodipicolinate synthase/N-acetylneuraminate lyase
MSTKKYKGVVVPTVTPLTDNFQLDEHAVEKIFEHFYSNNAEPFILGTTGEAASIPINIKKQFIKKAASIKKQGTLLYTGISSNCFDESIELANYAAEVGADVVVATIPSYYALTEIQTKKYFETLADKSPLPVIIYNITATTHVSLPLDWLNELSYHNNIVAAKDSERSDERLEQSITLWKDRKDFSHFVGWAARSAKALLLGSDGIIPSTGNVVASIYKILIDAVVNGDEVTAYKMQQLSDDIGAVYQVNKTLGESLWALKVLMQSKGLCEPIVMPPLQSLDEAEKNSLVKKFSAIEY